MVTKKKATPDVAETNPVWDIDVPEVQEPVQAEPTYTPPVAIAKPDIGYDLEGLMTDFPTATELQKFVYDQTGIVLNLKGRANKLKYQVALDTLNGTIPDTVFIGTQNPYLDKNELIPQDPLRELPARDPDIDAAGGEVTRFSTKLFPHPDPEWRAKDEKCHVIFRKYTSGMITYEIIGPIARKAFGTKINKFGQEQPEKIGWVDPRTGEQIVRRSDGSITPVGTRLRGFMKRQQVNKSNQWDVWIDRDFMMVGDLGNDNPWGS
jgi:hypothetical protein